MAEAPKQKTAKKPEKQPESGRKAVQMPPYMEPMAKFIGRVRQFADKTLSFVKRKPKTSIFLGVLALIGLFIWWGFQPIKGSIYYGVCRVFIERQLRYPETMDVINADLYAAEWRIFYNYQDEFGSLRSEMMKCVFGPASNSAGFKIVHAERLQGTRRAEVDQKTLDSFNRTIPAVVAAGPNLIMPWPPGDTLMELKKK